jgi:hypothetical protein
VAQILYEALIQSVQRVSLGTEDGRLLGMLKIVVRVSGPVIFSILVRVSLTHRVFSLVLGWLSDCSWMDRAPWTYCLRQSILRTEGYNAWTCGTREGELDEMLNSTEQPVVKFVTTEARVALLQAGAAQALLSQLSTG